MTLLSVEQHFMSWASGVEAEVAAKAHAFVEWFKAEETKVTDAVALLKAKGMQVIHDGVTL